MAYDMAPIKQDMLIGFRPRQWAPGRPKSIYKTLKRLYR
jgi:hypothetical protein